MVTLVWDKSSHQLVWEDVGYSRRSYNNRAAEESI